MKRSFSLRHAEKTLSLHDFVHHKARFYFLFYCFTLSGALFGRGQHWQAVLWPVWRHWVRVRASWLANEWLSDKQSYSNTGLSVEMLLNLGSRSSRPLTWLLMFTRKVCITSIFDPVVHCHSSFPRNSPKTKKIPIVYKRVLQATLLAWLWSVLNILINFLIFLTKYDINQIIPLVNTLLLDPWCIWFSDSVEWLYQVS